MGSFFAELAKTLADRWVTLLLIPGALYAAAVGIGFRVGQLHALDFSHLTAAVTNTATLVSHQSAGTQAVVVAAVLLGASGIGLVVQALAGLTRLLWLGSWPHILALVQRRCVAGRRRRWHECVRQRRTLEQAHPRASRTTEQQQQINIVAERVNRIAWAEPGRPTWMGDRIHALGQIALNRHGLDLTFAWPRLWLVLPETARSEITSADAAFAAAVATGSWAWPYLLLGALWWPAALIGFGIGIVGWVRARAAISDLTALSEAALDLYGGTLATALGIALTDRTGPLTLAEGEQLTALIRKGR